MAPNPIYCPSLLLRLCWNVRTLPWSASSSCCTVGFVLTRYFLRRRLQHFAKEPKNPLGRIVLNSYFVSKMDDSASFEFCVNAYPKVRCCCERALQTLARADVVASPRSSPAVPGLPRTLSRRDGGVDQRSDGTPARAGPRA